MLLVFLLSIPIVPVSSGVTHMKSSYFSYLVCIVTLATAFSLKAESPHEQSAVSVTNKEKLTYFQRIGFTPEQMAKIDPILLRTKEELKALKSDTSLNKDEKQD